MVCKLHEIINFVREHSLLNDLSDEEIKETFDLFPHACSWDKQLGISMVDCDQLDIITDKTMEVLDLHFEHEYTKEQIHKVATTFCDVFDAARAPKKPVPFVILLLARL